MESLRSTYDDDGDRTPSPPAAVSAAAAYPHAFRFPMPPPPPPPPLAGIQIPPPPAEPEAGLDEVHTPEEESGEDPNPNPALSETFDTPALDLVSDDGDDDDEDEDGSRKKQKTLSSFISPSTATPSSAPPAAAAKKPKKKNNNVWTKPASRKGKKKSKSIVPVVPAPAQDTVLIAPIPRFPDKSDDSPDARICLSRVYKAEKVEISDDRLSASSSKGYRMVRATRGVMEGAWYFEIRVVCLGETGHTRLGWATEKGDLQAPVGYDENSYGYRDIDGSKIHKALQEKYGEEGYAEGDVIGIYINLPDGESYAPKPPHLVWFKGQKYMYSMDGKDESLRVVPGSEVSFFKNGVCQGVAFTNLVGGRYYPAASMYTQILLAVRPLAL